MSLNQNPYLPIGLALGGVFLFSVMDAVMKAQALAMGTYSAMYWRNAMGALFAAILYLPSRPQRPSPDAFRLHVGRSALTAVMMYCFFFGLTRVPLAQAIGLTFVAPIIALFLASPFLGERIGPNAKFAALLGFGGVMVVVGGDLLRMNAEHRPAWGECHAGFRRHVRRKFNPPTKARTHRKAHGNHVLSKYVCAPAHDALCAATAPDACQ